MIINGSEIIMTMEKSQPQEKELISTSNMMLEEIHRQLKETRETDSLPDDYQEILKSFVLDIGSSKCPDSVSKILSKRDFYISNKEFSLDDMHGDNYFLILNLFRAVVFTRCDFKVSNVPFSIEVRFDSSHFLEELSFNPTTFKQINQHTIFDNCNFFKDVELISYDHQNDLRSTKPSVEATLFQQCSFFSELSAKHLQFKAPMFFDEKYGSYEGCIEDEQENNIQNYLIRKLIIHDCIFEDSAGIYANHYQFEKVSLLRSKFKGKFEFKNNHVNDCCIDDCNFEKVSDFFGSEFDTFKMRKTIFTDFAAFEVTKFGKQDSGTQNHAAIFKYVTFNQFTNFRAANFFDGLDIEKSNFAQPPNFLGAYVDIENSPRETFRIIKNSFDSVGNFIEANKFFSYEMEKNKQELSLEAKKTATTENEKKELKKAKSDLIIFRLNSFFSDFGQNWKRPLMLLIFLAVIAQFLYCRFEDIGVPKDGLWSSLCEISEQIKYAICSPSFLWLAIPLMLLASWLTEVGKYISLLIAPTVCALKMDYPETNIFDVFTALNAIAKQIPPFNKLPETGHEFTSLIINILFAVLIWQLVVAVKRLTRR